jgi:hypothetical protein
MNHQPDAIPLAPPAAYATDKTARAKIAWTAIKALCASILGVLTGVDWVEMSAQQQFMAIIAITLSLATAMEALYDKTMSSRAAGKAAASGNTNPPFQPKSL